MPQNAKILDGKALAERALELVSARVAELKSKAGRSPGLGVILVGENPASKVYVGNKEKLAQRAGFRTFNRHLDAAVSFDELRRTILELNANAEVDGILLQLPLPKGLDADAAIDLISPLKDADGLHPANQGLLMRGKGTLRPCTPLGVMKLIDLAASASDCASPKFAFDKLAPVNLAGKRAVVVGRSILVGKPVSLLLLERHATVTVAHSRTADLAAVCREADILVAAVGAPELIKGDWIKPGAIVIDVGINRLDSGPRKGKLVGDVEFDSCAGRASAITPVPGGVGPMTVAMLIHNTMSAFAHAERVRD